LEFGGIWWRDIKKSRDYEVMKNPVKSGFQSRQTAFDALDFECGASANSATSASLFQFPSPESDFGIWRDMVEGYEEP